MNTPLITWLCIAGTFAAIVLVRLIRIIVKDRCHIIEIGTEREEFFIPGDPDPNDEYYDYDE